MGERRRPPVGRPCPGSTNGMSRGSWSRTCAVRTPSSTTSTAGIRSRGAPLIVRRRPCWAPGPPLRPARPPRGPWPSSPPGSRPPRPSCGAAPAAASTTRPFSVPTGISLWPTVVASPIPRVPPMRPSTPRTPTDGGSGASDPVARASARSSRPSRRPRPSRVHRSSPVVHRPNLGPAPSCGPATSTGPATGSAPDPPTLLRRPLADTVGKDVRDRWKMLLPHAPGGRSHEMARRRLFWGVCVGQVGLLWRPGVGRASTGRAAGLAPA